MQAEVRIKPQAKSNLVTKSQTETALELLYLSDSRERLWTREEYYKLAEEGFFDGQRVELIEGRILLMSAMNALHRNGVIKADRVLQKVFTQGFHVSTQCPLSIGEASDPKPDIAVVEGSEDDYIEAHPTTAVLIVEISDSSLEYDQTAKASLYAKAKVPDYWIVNLRDKRLEVRRRPMRDKTQPFGFGYAELVLYSEKESVSPLAKPKTKIAVKHLLPRKQR